jgi:hypothetical protein
MSGGAAMVKEDFKQALRSKLGQIPVETRRGWSDNDLFIWWLKAKAADPYLVWERCPGDAWQWVPGMCSDLIRERAV